MSSSSWREHQLHVMTTLDRLEQKHDDLAKFIKEHMKEEERRFDLFAERINKVETDVKWYARIVTGVWAVISTGLIVWIKKL